MKKLLCTMGLGICLAGTMSAQSLPQLTPDNIDEVIAAMTLEEKAHMVNGIGTFWGGPVRSWRDIPGAPGGTYAIPRLGIPGLYFGDGPLGLRIAETREFDNHKYSITAEPVPLLVGSSWDPELIYNVAQDIGEECREYGVDVMLGPSFNIQRNPLGGRTHEYYSEDPYLSGILAGAFTKGVQSVGVGASVKHFAVNNQETNRNAVNSIVSQRALREIYLKAFEVSIKECEPWTVMTSYNGLNGDWTAENKQLLEDVLRGDWGFKGMVMTDWGGGMHAVQMMEAGNDLLEPGSDRHIQDIIKAVQDGTLDEAVLDKNIRRILEMVVKSHTYKKYPFTNEPNLKAHRAMARQAGAEGAILLKNDNQALPFSQAIRDVAIYGKTGYKLIPGGIGPGESNAGNYHISLVEGLRLAGYEVDYDLVKTYRSASSGGGMPWMNPGAEKKKADDEIIPEAADLTAQAARNDIALVVLGHVSGEGSDRPRAEFYLTDKEKQLVKDVTTAYHAAGKKVVVLLNIPGAIEMESWKDIPDAILCMYQGGEQFGNWVADVLTGAVTPSGKLIVTFAKDLMDYPSSKNYPILDEKLGMSGMAAGASGFTRKDKMTTDGTRNKDYTIYEEGIYVGYRYFDTFGVDVTYPFGYGLSYTTFEYSNPKITKDGDEFTVSVTIKNTGNYCGREVAQLYVSAPKGTLDKPKKELKGFAKTKTLKPGESETLTMTVKAEDLASFNPAKSQWETDKGEYTFLIGASVADIKASLAGAVDKAYIKKVRNVLAPPIAIRELKP